jgi:hypothetical protein
MVQVALVVLLLQVMLPLWLASPAFAEASAWLQNGERVILFHRHCCGGWQRVALLLAS